MHFRGNFLIYFFTTPEAMKAFNAITENLYFHKDGNKLRCFAGKEDAQIEYADTSKGIVLFLNSNESLTIKPEHIDCVKDEKGKILWQS